MRLAPRAPLYAAPLLDELTTGFLTIAVPLLRDRYHLTYEQIGLLFSAGALSALVIEPGINLLSDRGPKRALIVAATLVLALGFLAAGLAPAYLVLVGAFVAMWPAIGVSVGLSQAALIDGAPDAGERTMTRWTLLSGVGDLLAPLVIGAFALLALGWLALCAAACALWLVFAACIALRPLPASSAAHAQHDESGEESDLSLLGGARAALRDRTLLRWLVVVLLADMMDEVFLAFAGLYLRDQLHYPAALAGFALGANLAGGLLAIVVLDRLAARLTLRRLLPWLALLALTGVVLLLLAPAPWVAVAGLFCAGAGAAGWYPIAKAAAYAELPGRSGTVRAILGLGEPYNVALPGLTGLIAGRFGVGASVAFLGLSGVGVLLCSPRAVSRPCPAPAVRVE